MKSEWFLIVFAFAASCKPNLPTEKVPARYAMINTCWQTFDLGLKDKNDFVKNSTILTLGRIGNRKAIETLKAVDVTANPSVIRPYTRVLSQLHDTMAFLALYDHARSTDFQIRENVIIGLARMGDLYDRPTMTRIFKKMLSEIDTMKVDTVSYDREEIVRGKEELRAKVAVALLRFGEASARRYVEPILQSGDFSPKVNLVKMIGVVRADEAVDIAVRLSRDPSTYVRAKSAEALGLLQGSTAITTLRQMLSVEKAEDVRIEAAIGLMKADEAAAVATLVESLNTPNDDVRSKILLAFTNVQSAELRRELIPIVRQQAASPSEWVRISAIGALGSFRDTTSFDIFEAGLDDKLIQVKEISIGVLASMRSAEMVDDLIDYLRDEQYSMRSVAISGLGQIRDPNLLDGKVIPAIYDRLKNDQEMVVRVRAAFTLLDLLHDHAFTKHKDERG
jgi:HEAT repeat protein